MSRKLSDSDNYNFIFNNIVNLCRKNGTSVTNLARMFTQSSSHVERWKNGTISPDVLISIAEYFGVSLDYLMTGKAETKLTQNEEELLSVFNNFNYREQLKIIGRVEECLDRKNRKENIGIQVARTTDGIPVRQEVTPEILETIKNLPEDTDY
ncbi:MAG: helix-turn-helix domain-containing protein [Ruminococcus sp.]|nr:helix-turn-helix domain-containing protein [Ruminococcus sp.]